MSGLENVNPVIKSKLQDRPITQEETDDDVYDPIDGREVFDLIRSINDPEHPLTLEELGVVDLDKIEVSDKEDMCSIYFTPTIPHCSMATLIGLSIRVRLIRSLPGRFKVSVKITPGTHASEFAINKQLADKERVAAALENSNLIRVVNQCLKVDKRLSNKETDTARIENSSLLEALNQFHKKKLLDIR